MKARKIAAMGWRKKMASDTFGLAHIMQKSKIVEVDGIFIGAAVQLADCEGWRFVAADRRADEANGRIVPTLHDAQQLAKRAFFSSRSPAGTKLPAAPDTAANARPLHVDTQLRASA
jgi:hypothetical protein